MIKAKYKKQRRIYRTSRFAGLANMIEITLKKKIKKKNKRSVIALRFVTLPFGPVKKFFL